MEERILEAVEALARYVSTAEAMEELLDATPSTIGEIASPEVAWWVAYLQGVADEADVTVRELLDEHGISIDECFTLFPRLVGAAS